MVFRFIKLTVFLYFIIFLVKGAMDYRVASKNFYCIDRHFSLHSTYTKDLPKSIIKGGWCSVIAEPDFIKKTEKERKKYAKDFFDNEIANIAKRQGYDVTELKDWFLRYAAYDVESMPVREFFLDWKGERSILYREIDLAKKPNRNIMFFFSDPDLYKDSLWAMIGIGIPLIIVYLFISHKKIYE